MNKGRGFYDRGLEVCAIQYSDDKSKKNYFEKLDSVLSRLDKDCYFKADSDIVMYSNVLSNLRIGKYISVPRFFDTCLYSVESNLLVMFMNGGVIDSDDIREYLDGRGIFYNEVVIASQEIEYRNNFLIPELCFVRDKFILEKQLIDSIDKGHIDCKYYPYLEGRLDLGYLTNYCEELINLDARNIKGLIQFDDKILLLIYRSKKRKICGVTLDEVRELFVKYDINCEFCDNDQFSLNDYSKKGVKSKKLLLSDNN